MTDKKTKVLMFGWEFPPMLNGGLGAACYGLTRHLALEGISITFVLPHISKRMHHYFLDLLDGSSYNVESSLTKKQREELYGHLESCIEYDALLAPYEGTHRYEEIFNRIKKDETQYRPTLLAEVARYAKLGEQLGREKKFDIIHVHDWMSFEAGISAKKVSGKPLVVHFHSTEFDRRVDAVDKEIVRVEQKGLDKADKVVVVSKLMKKQILKRYNVSASKIEVVYNAVEKGETISFDKKLTEFRNKKVVFFLGRITTQKGPTIFLDAAEKIRKKIDDVVFIMAGDGDMASYVKQQCHKKNMDECFFFPGHLRGVEKEKLLAISDIYVLSSLAEPFGITLAEVMCYEIPIIMTEGLGAKEVVPSALEFKFGDSSDLAQKIEQLLNSAELGDSIVKNYGKHLDRLDWNVSAQKIIQIYNQLQ
jgi:glycosyltransferase involved in cell wall biosynthesis